MEETLFKLEIFKTPKLYLLKLESETGGIREYRSPSFEEALEQVVNEIREEYLEK